MDTQHGACRAVAARSEDGLYSLRFELRNPADAEVELSIHEPFTAFSVLATAGGRALPVHQPALDIPVNPKTLRVPPGGTLTLPTPIRLRISEGAGAGRDGFVWTIPHAPEAVSLQVRLDLPAPFATPCTVSFE